MSEEAYSNEKDYKALLKVLDNAKANGCKRIALEIQRTPDPDAMATALVMKHVCERRGLEADITHASPLSRQNNILMKKRLGIETVCYGTNGTPGNGVECKADQYDGFIFLDHSGGTSEWSRKGQIPPEKVLVVIDHHELEKQVSVPYANRQQVGASATLVGELLMEGLLEEIGDTRENGLMKTMATALILGIRSDTDKYTKRLTPRDHKVYQFLSQFADVKAVLDIENAKVPQEWLDYLATALNTRRKLRNNMLIAGVGHLKEEERDVIAYVADIFHGVKGHSGTWVVGIQPTIYDFSFRTDEETFDYGRLDGIAKSIHSDGCGGGKEGAGGMQVPNKVTGDMMDDGSREWRDMHLERILKRLAAELGDE